ncbi:MAG: phospholipase [Chloroflexi bacterium]|nr:phospholipase [Chloroflexota bacterium]
MTSKVLSLNHLYLPPRRTSAGKPPLLILLHGFGSNEQDLFGLHPYLDERFAVVSARGPLTLQPGSHAWYRVQWLADGTMHMDDAEAEAAIRAVTAFVHEAVEAYGADSARVFIGGFSQGAIMSECVALTQPRLVAGAVLMSGRTLDLLHRHDLQPAAGYPPMIVVHGTVDRVLSIDEGRATQSFLQALAVDFEYREYPMAHQISDESLDEIDTWLSAHLDASESL